MKKQLFYLLILIYAASCQADKNKEKAILSDTTSVSEITPEKTSSQNSAFTPDTSINKLLLVNSESIENSLGDLMQYLDKDADIPYVFILSKDQKQYLKLSFFPGSNKNEFSYFEIGMLKDTLLNNQFKVLSEFKSFITENNIKIGISKQEFLKNRDKNAFKIKNDNVFIYEIGDFKSSTFLKSYNMPYYSAKYRFDNDTLVQFEFGFEYP